MKPHGLIWERKDHTRAKHEILKRYLQAWFPILSLGGFPRIAVIDGFAGPGVYEDGSDGSPIVALKVFLDQPRQVLADVHFHFIEKDVTRATRLHTCIEELFAARPQPRNLHWHIHDGMTFEEAYLVAKGAHPRTTPIFALVDPFGWKDTPMSAIADLMDRASGEVLINFMFEEINRFLTHPDQGGNFDALFGCPAWRDAANLPPGKRQAALRDLYASQLKVSAGARYVRHFEMRNKRERTDYYLFFATKSLAGLKKMKEAMWSVDQTGEMVFSDATDPNQMVLFDKDNTSGLEANLIVEFAGRTVLVEDIELFVLERTAYRDTHYKGILKAMERREPEALAVVAAKDGRRRGTFPPGTVVRFAEQRTVPRHRPQEIPSLAL